MSNQIPAPKTPDASKFKSAMQDVVDISAELQEELRELLSYCRTKADGPTIDGIWGHNEVYDEIAKRLANILDGE